MSQRGRFAAMLLALLVPTFCADGATLTLDAPSMDKWVYANADGGRNPYGGTRDVAALFATLNTDDTDRLGTMLLGFETTNWIPTGLGASSYAITSVRLTVTISTDESFIYDSTYDSYRNFLTSLDPNYLPDADAGHPIEVFGVGLRNGYTALSGAVGVPAPHYGENSPYATSGNPQPENVYPIGISAGGSLYDVSDNVSAGMEAFPFAIGKAYNPFLGDLYDGEYVPAGTEFRFDLEITNPAVLAYIQEALNIGVLGLMISSLHEVEGQITNLIYPRILTRENALGANFSPRLEISYAIVPEPQFAGILLAGCVLLAGTRNFRRSTPLS